MPFCQPPSRLVICFSMWDVDSQKKGFRVQRYLLAFFFLKKLPPKTIPTWCEMVQNYVWYNSMGQHGKMQKTITVLNSATPCASKSKSLLGIDLVACEIRNWCASLGDMREIHTGMRTINILLIHNGQCVYYCIWDTNVNDIACIIGFLQDYRNIFEHSDYCIMIY